jgi:rod shape-determining protein MreD
MIAHLLLPLLLLLLVVVQTTILNLLTLGWFGLEVSLIVVVFAGFHLDLLRGGLVSLLLGFFLDCLTSAIFGLHLFLYLLLYFLSTFAADKVYAEKPLLIASFTGFCSLLEGLLIVLLYRLLLNADISGAIPKLFIPQAIVVGLLSPSLFGLLHRYEVFLHAEDTRPARRL